MTKNVLFRGTRLRGTGHEDAIRIVRQAKRSFSVPEGLAS